MSIFSDAWEIAEDAWDAAVEGGEKLLDRLDDAYEHAVDELERIGSQIEDISVAVAEELEEIGRTAVAGVETTLDAAWGYAENTIDSTIGLIEAVPAALSDADAAWDLIEGAVLEPFENAEDGIEQSLHAVLGTTLAAADNLLTTLETAYDSTANAGALLVDQLEHTFEEHVRLTELTIEIIGEDLRDLTKLFGFLSACEAGGIVYGLAKGDAIIYNFTPPSVARNYPIPAILRRTLEAIPQFASIEFERASFVENAHLPADYFGTGTSGMTFSGVHLSPYGVEQVVGTSNVDQVILLAGHYDATIRSQNELLPYSRFVFGRRDLAHELVHVGQIQGMGEIGFACAYGVGYAQAGFDYEENPIEAEAFNSEPLVP